MPTLPHRSRWVQAAWLVLFAFAGACAGAEPALDADYRVIPQQPVANPARIEVIDFFFYGCPHCNELRPRLERWRESKPADVDFRRIPTVRHDTWVPLARTYYTLETMGEVERLHAAVYHSYHVEDLGMSRESVIAEWAKKQGLDADKFMAIYRSAEVTQQVERARKLTRDYDIEGTPSLIVDGRMLMEGSLPETIDVLDALVKIARQRRTENKSK